MLLDNFQAVHDLNLQHRLIQTHQRVVFVEFKCRVCLIFDKMNAGFPRNVDSFDDKSEYRSRNDVAEENRNDRSSPLLY